MAVGEGAMIMNLSINIRYHFGFPATSFTSHSFILAYSNALASAGTAKQAQAPRPQLSGHFGHLFIPTQETRFARVRGRRNFMYDSPPE